MLYQLFQSSRIAEGVMAKSRDITIKRRADIGLVRTLFEPGFGAETRRTCRREIKPAVDRGLARHREILLAGS
jgi:hypothetical protein